MKEISTQGDQPAVFGTHTEKSRLVAELAGLLMEYEATMTTAESCTGGLIAGALTDMPGSSAWFEQSVVTYSNHAKQQLLGVPELIFEQDGAVSEACVLAMAQGAQQRSGAFVAVAASGIAGPDGAVPGKPVGTVWLGWAVGEQLSAELLHLQGDRLAVREQAVLHALRGTIARIRNRE
ncbi:CinA family protein [Granulosicoccus sp. 3-233]|uniref:CinA family protein n=1 Tax=Granulosicoccus sp. 3-233 TaxID=3417969 RepID=UPI003D3539E3